MPGAGASGIPAPHRPGRRINRLEDIEARERALFANIEAQQQRFESVAGNRRAQLQKMKLFEPTRKRKPFAKLPRGGVGRAGGGGLTPLGGSSASIGMEGSNSDSVAAAAAAEEAELRIAFLNQQLKMVQAQRDTAETERDALRARVQRLEQSNEQLEKTVHQCKLTLRDNGIAFQPAGSTNSTPRAQTLQGSASKHGGSHDSLRSEMGSIKPITHLLPVIEGPRTPAELGVHVSNDAYMAVEELYETGVRLEDQNERLRAHAGKLEKAVELMGQRGGAIGEYVD